MKIIIIILADHSVGREFIFITCLPIRGRVDTFFFKICSRLGRWCSCPAWELNRYAADYYQQSLPPFYRLSYHFNRNVVSIILFLIVVFLGLQHLNRLIVPPISHMPLQGPS